MFVPFLTLSENDSGDQSSTKSTSNMILFTYMKMTYDMLFADLITLTFYPKEPVPASFEVK